jgi:hypothetical protein
MLCAVLAMATTAVMWTTPDLWGTDRFFNEVRLLAWDHCLRDGVLWPRWIPDMAHGHGFPFFHFYPAGLYILAEPFLLMGFDARHALLLVLTLGLGASAFCVYRMVADRVGTWLGVMGACLWLTAPYLQVNLQVRHAWSELMGLSFLPLALWGFLDLAEGKRTNMAWLKAGVGYGLIVMTHPVITVMATGGITLLVMALITSRLAWHELPRCFIPMLGAMGLTAFFWLPALLDRDLIRVAEMKTGFFSLSAHVIYPEQLLGIHFGRGPSIPGPDDEMSLSMGLLQGLLLSMAMLMACIRWRKVGARAWFFGLCALGAIGLVLPQGNALLELLPGLNLIQFPFRLLGPLALMVALAVPFIAAALLSPRRVRLLAGGISLTLLFSTLPTFTELRHMTPEEWAAYEPIRQKGADGIRHLDDPYTTTAGVLEYLPRTVKSYPTRATEKAWDAPPWVTVDQIHTHCDSIHITGDAEQATALRLGTFDFEGFEVYRNGRLVLHRHDLEFGFILVPIDKPGPFRLEINQSTLGSSPLGTLCSALSFVLFLGLLWRQKGRTQATKRQRS